MKRAWLVVAGALCALVVGGVVAARPNEGEAGGDKARALLVAQGGAAVGVAKFEQQGDEVQLKVTVSAAIAPGFHGFHVHAKGECTGTFTSAMGHYNPGGATHRDHAGDLPVLLVAADGTAEARFSTERFDVSELFDADGSALIIHAGPDNYANIPTDRYEPDPDTATLSTGDAGGRAACGIIENGD